jgi:hypothetical protein
VLAVIAVHQKPEIKIEAATAIAGLVCGRQGSTLQKRRRPSLKWNDPASGNRVGLTFAI